MKCIFEVNTICRLCLRVSEKVYKLNNTHHKAFIESIIKLKNFYYVPTDDEYVCYICNALLKKAFNFMQTIWNAQEIICVILKDTDKITKPMLECIDRHNNGLNPVNLSSVVICDNVESDSSDDNSASTDIEELDHDIVIDKINGQTKKEQKHKNDRNKIKNHSTNEKRQIVGISFTSDEDKEPDKCNLDEVEVEIDAIKTETGDPLTKDLDILIDKTNGQTKKEQKHKNNRNKIMNNSTNEKRQIVGISFTSDEDKDPDKCNSDEVEVEIDAIKTKTGDPLTKDLDISIDKINGQTKKEQKHQNKHNKIKNHSTNEKRQCISISSTSDEDKEPDKCNLDEVEVEIDAIKTKTGDPLTNDLDILIDKINGQTKKEQKHKNNRNKIKYLSTNKKRQIICISSTSDDDKEPDKCNLDEVEVEIDAIKTETRDPLTKDLNTDTEACDDPKPQPKKKIDIAKRMTLYKAKSGAPPGKRQKKVEIDDDYQPDSTSHSEDSDYDSYDDEGKRITRPRHGRVYPRKCDHCDYEVQKAIYHYRHYLCSHPNTEYPYKLEKNNICSVCGKLCTRDKIRAHEASHATQKLKCSLCPNVYSNKIRLYTHKQQVHPKRILTCDYCSKIFKTRTCIVRHIRTHTGSKPFKCHICGDGFAHSGNRSVHIRTKHQNYKCAPKKHKRARKVRRNKKRNSTDTEDTSSSEKTIRRTRTKRKTKTKM